MALWAPTDELLLWRALHRDKASRSKMAFGELGALERGEVLLRHKSYTLWALQQPATAVGVKHQDFVNFAACYVEIAAGDLVVRVDKLSEEDLVAETHGRPTDIPEGAQQAAQAIAAARILLSLPAVALDQARSAVTIAMAPDSQSVREVLELVARQMGS